MKKQLLALCLILSGVVTGWSQADYLQWSVVTFKPKLGQVDMFDKGLAAHNKKFHAAAPYKAGVFKVRTGPGTGSYYLTMGPMTFTQMAGRPSGEEHDSDWKNGVIAYTESIGESSFWRASDEVNYRPATADNYTMARFRFITVLPGEWDRFEHYAKMIEAVYEAKGYKATCELYWKYGASQGPNALMQMWFADLAYLDEVHTWEKDFKEVHGEDGWDRFRDDIELAVDRSKTYDELVEFIPALSSDR